MRLQERFKTVIIRRVFLKRAGGGGGDPVTFR